MKHPDDNTNFIESASDLDSSVSFRQISKSKENNFKFYFYFIWTIKLHALTKNEIHNN